MSTPARCTGAIIAGGRATRFGGIEKGLERVGGVRMIDRVAAALEASCDAIAIVANSDTAGEWIPGTRVIRDMRPDAGALGGLHAALATLGSPILAVAWDSPFVPADLLAALRATGERHGADAAVPVSNAPVGFEPLCAWYAPSCVGAIERHLDNDDRRAGGWQDDVRCVKLDVSRWGDPDALFFNVNSAVDLAEANAIAQRAAR